MIDIDDRFGEGLWRFLKKAVAIATHAGGRLNDERYRLIVQVCDEILAGQHKDMFPLHVWMTGSGTQFNMNMNQIISSRCSQLQKVDLSQVRRRAELTFASVLGFVIGLVFGAVLELHFGLWSLIFPSLLAVVAIPLGECWTASEKG